MEKQTADSILVDAFKKKGFLMMGTENGPVNINTDMDVTIQYHPGHVELCLKSQEVPLDNKGNTEMVDVYNYITYESIKSIMFYERKLIQPVPKGKIVGTA